VVVDTTDRESICHGRAISSPRPLSGPVAIVNGEELIAVANANGTELKPLVVLAG
jgi:hypothetical protein